MVFYNGVRMDLLNINSLARDAVYSPDGVDYLYTHFLVDVTCFVHNAYLSDNRLFGFRDHVGADRVLRALLLQPRRKLKITFETGGAEFAQVEPGRSEDSFAASDAANPFVQRGPYPYLSEMGLGDAQFARDNNFPPFMDNSGIDANPAQTGSPSLTGGRLRGGQIVNEGANDNPEEVLYLESPYGGSPVDDKDGPLPIDCSVDRVIGENGFVVSWRVQTWVNECATSLGVTSADQIALQSNRFTMVHDVDEDYNTTRTVQGVAVFRTSVLATQNINPDALRNQLFVPIPPAFQRKGIQVRQASDGTAVAYLVVDVQTPVVFTPNPSIDATHMECVREIAMGNQGDISSSILNSMNGYYQWKLNQKWLHDQAQSAPPMAASAAGGGAAPAAPHPDGKGPGPYPVGNRGQSGGGGAASARPPHPASAPFPGRN